MNISNLQFFNFFRSEFGLFNYVMIFACALTIFAVMFETYAIVYVIPISECDLNLTTSQKGILGAAAFLRVISASCGAI